MTKYEKLLEEARKHGIESYELPLSSDCGYYVDNVAYINRSSTNAEKHGTLGEELGHHFTSTGNILNQNDTNNKKQEQKARGWGIEHTVPLTTLVEAIDYPCLTRTELANYLEVTEKLLMEAIEYYKQKYGLYVTINEHTIWFEPLRLIKMFTDKK
nr:ImmA/IrrE family metallo-endopeptidase [uncultured Cellulosilyticum sp.]